MGRGVKRNTNLACKKDRDVDDDGEEDDWDDMTDNSAETAPEINKNYIVVGKIVIIVVVVS